MKNDPETMIDGAYRAWQLSDRDVMLASFTDEAVFSQHISQEAFPFAGTSIGKGRLAEPIDRVFADWAIEAFMRLTNTRA